MKRENIIDALDMIDEELLNNAMDYREQKKARRFSFSKLAAIAAAAVLVISATVMTATATYRFEVDPQDANEAFAIAQHYIIQNAENRDPYNVMIAYGLEAWRYDESAEGKLSGLKPVVNLKFKVAGYSYDAVVDLNAGEVIRCDKKYDPNWDDYTEQESYSYAQIHTLISAGKSFDDIGGNINNADAMRILYDYFEINDSCANRFSYFVSEQSANGLGDSCESVTILLSYVHSGYIYSCRIDPVTGEVSDASTTEITDDIYSAKKHLHEHTDNPEFIGFIKACSLASEALGLPDKRDDFPSVLFYYSSQGNYFNGVDFIKPDDVEAFYHYTMRPSTGSNRVNVFLDAKTGEILKIEESDDNLKSNYEGFER